MGVEATVVSARRGLGMSWGGVGVGRLLSPSVRDWRVLTSPLRYTCSSLLDPPFSLSLLAASSLPSLNFRASLGQRLEGLAAS